MNNQFRCFFAVGSREYLWLLLVSGAKNILVSFAYQEPFKSIKLLKRHECDLLLDSGAFTAWSKGKAVDIDEYIEFIKKTRSQYPHKIEYVNLDVIPGTIGKKPTSEDVEEAALKGYENLLYMQSKGLNPIHVFHQGEHFDWLKKMCDKCDYIGISPCNDYSDKVKTEWLQQAFDYLKRIGKIGKVKTHAFGMTSTDLLKRFPFSSADSSSYAFTSAFGVVFTPGGKCVISTTQEKHPDYIEYKPKEIRDKIIEHIESYGFSYKLAKENYKFRNIVNISHFLDIEEEINKNPVQFESPQNPLFNFDY